MTLHKSLVAAPSTPVKKAIDSSVDTALSSAIPPSSIDADTESDASVCVDESIVTHNNANHSAYQCLALTGALVWPSLLTVPLLLSHSSSPLFYAKLFPVSWYEYEPRQPKPLGLCLGILAVAVGQVGVMIFFYLLKFGYLGTPQSIQTKGARAYDYLEGLKTHVSQPEGFVLLVGYLTLTWMLNLMPASYYSFDGTIQYHLLFLCLVLQDGIQYVMHLLEHLVSPTFYQLSHKPHHRFTNPRLFDAFNGSVFDTLFMIIVPLFLTANLVRTSNIWTYMAFGSTYASWLTLIHSEYVLAWDPLFRTLGFGTPADHHVHHKFFKYNYGHLFMWFDRIGGTYKNPKDVSVKVFRQGV